LVTQSFSKSRSLAGLRLGFAVGHVDLIDALTRIKDSFNSYPIDRLASAGGIAAMQDVAHFEQTRQRVITAREEMVAGLHDFGFEVLPSAANFVFARHPQHDAAELMQALREQAVIVRHFNKPRIDQFLRITIGTPEENAALLSALRAALA
jgi:histidinol-phosphate aminotransferase